MHRPIQSAARLSTISYTEIDILVCPWSYDDGRSGHGRLFLVSPVLLADDEREHDGVEDRHDLGVELNGYSL